MIGIKSHCWENWNVCQSWDPGPVKAVDSTWCWPVRKASSISVSSKGRAAEKQDVLFLELGADVESASRALSFSAFVPPRHPLTAFIYRPPGSTSLPVLEGPWHCWFCSCSQSLSQWGTPLSLPWCFFLTSFYHILCLCVGADIWPFLYSFLLLCILIFSVWGQSQLTSWGWALLSQFLPCWEVRELPHLPCLCSYLILSGFLVLPSSFQGLGKG